MLKPDYIQKLPEDLANLFLRLEEDIILDISKKLKDSIEEQNELSMTGSAEYLTERLTAMGYDLGDIEEKIAKTIDVSVEEIEEILSQSSELSYLNDKELYKKGGKILPVSMDPGMQDFIKATIKNSQNDLKNLTRTMGIATNAGFKDLTKYYRDSLNYATVQLGSGAYTYQEAIDNAVRDLARSGIRTIDYKSGRSYHLGTAVRMNVLTANSQITGYMSEQNADMMGQDLMEITSHLGARPSHESWHGKIVSRSGNNRKYLTLGDIGYGDPGGFKGVYCRHDWFPFFEGISIPAPREKERKPVTYNGRTYDDYQASQYQRAIERRMRATKREISAYKGAGLKDKETAAKIKLRRQSELYQDFSNHAGIRAKWERARVIY